MDITDSRSPRRLMKLVLTVPILFLLIQATTYGWRLSRPYTARLSEEENSSAENLKRIVHHLAGDIGTRNYHSYANLDKTAEFIIQSFEGMGYVVTVMPYEMHGKAFKNIIAENPGQAKTKDIVLIGAHYDSCFNPGADDNASGVAGLIELARLLKEEPSTSKIRFAAFTNEEPPFFMTEQMGSRVYAREAIRKGEKIKVAVILEMIGYYSDKVFSQKYLPLLGPFYPNRANFIALVGNFQTHTITEKLYKAFQSHSDFPIAKITSPDFIPGINFSDHWSFWKEGIPALMVTDTAFLRNPYYHQATDTAQTLDYAKMSKMLYGLKRSIVEYLNAERP